MKTIIRISLLSLFMVLQGCMIDESNSTKENQSPSKQEIPNNTQKVSDQQNNTSTSKEKALDDASGNTTVNYIPDRLSNLRNPAMGWVMYEEGWSFKNGGFPDKLNTPELFWQQMEAVNAQKVANILYIRMTWKEFEPQEGQYAWQYNDQYKWYIKKAEEHGLKLAFRVFFHDAVPDYVYQAGAEENVDKKQPYYDDPIFLDKLDTFIKAFAKEYDNPDKVDFIDAYGLGTWGEGHGVILKDKKNRSDVIQRVTQSYADNFKNILTVMNLSASDYKLTKPLVYDKLGFLPRRDGLGSWWFFDNEKQYVKDMFPQKALIGEGAYWFSYPDGKNEQYTAFKDDFVFDMNNFNEALTVLVQEAIENRSNTLDLRVPAQAKFWIEELPDQVQKFTSNGGYRLYPQYIEVKQDGKTIELNHQWKNDGVGVLPNNHPNWNYKYQLSFGLLDSAGNLVYVYSTCADPGTWVKETPRTYKDTIKLSLPLKGKYTLVAGVTDKTKNNVPAIDLAVDNKLKIGKWVKVTDLIYP